MKTMKKITLTAVLIILTANLALANNYRTLRIFSPEGKLYEIISIIERPVKEIIPGYEGFTSEFKSNTIVEKMDLEVYNEPAADEFFVVAKENNKTDDAYASTIKFVHSIYVSEQTVNDLAFDTKAIFNEYHKEKEANCKQDLLTSLMIDETEVIDNPFQFQYITSVK